MEQRQLLEQWQIKDPVEIARLEKEFGYKFFIPKSEDPTLDFDIILSYTLNNSIEQIGQIEKIFVTINKEDPFKKSEVNELRTHGRVAGGRHKYKASINAKKRYEVVYIRVKDFGEFSLIRAQFEIQKSPQVRQKNLEMIIRQEAKYAYDVLGIYPKSKVGAWVVKKLGNGHPYHNATIYRHLPKEFINKMTSENISDSIKQLKKKSKKDIKIDELQKKLDYLERRNIELEEYSKPESDKDRIIKEQEEQIKKLRIEVSSLQKDIEHFRGIKEEV